MRTTAVSRAGRAALTAVLVAAVGLTTAVPAVAAAPAMSLRVVGGDGQLTAAWSAVPHATGYTVHWGAGASTGHTLHTRGTSIRIGGVANRTSYSVRVTADTVRASSARRTARPVPYVPTSIAAVRAVPAGPDRIRVSWSGGTQARSFAIIGGSDSMTTRNHFSTGWHPAALQSWTVTIPSRLHDVLGAGSGNAVFLKVALSNSTAPNPVKHLRFDLADRYRLTPSGTWSLAGAATAPRPVTKLSVASWNVQSITASAAFTAQDRWAARITRVAANIESLHPDLIGLQELTTARIEPGCLNHGGGYQCQEQYQSLQTALRSAATEYRNAREDANAWVYQQAVAHPNESAYVDSALFYNPAKLTPLASGFVSPRSIMGAGWPSTLTDEAGMWARFRSVAAPGRPARTFYALSIHLPAGSGSVVSALRKAEAQAVAAWIDARAVQPDGSSLPVVFVGDFNANGAMDPSAASLQLRRDGYIDAGATTDRGGYLYSSSNGTNGTDGPDPGYPLTAVQHPYPTSRIDYIMVRNSPFTYRYRNEVRLTPGTSRFDPRYQGSDHDLQLAIIGIADPSGASR